MIKNQHLDNKESDKSESEASKTSFSWLAFIKSLFVKNPTLTLLKAGLVVGGLIAYGFFAAIGYLPEFDLQNATTLLIGLALIGIGATAVLALVFIFPALLIQNFWSIFYAPIENIDGDSGQYKKEKALYAFNLIISSTLIGILTFSGWIIVLSLIGGFDYTIVGFEILSVVIALQTYRYWRFPFRHGKDITHKILGGKWVFTKSQLALLGAWFFPCYLLILILMRPIDIFIQQQNWFSFGFSIFLLLLIIFSNSMLAAGHLQNKNKKIIVFQSYLFMSLALLVGYLGMPSNQINLTKIPFKILNLGDIQDSVLVVNEETCSALNVLRPDSCIKIEKSGCVVPKTLASRIGSEYLLVFDEKAMPGKKIKEITIPVKKENVLGWSFGNNGKISQVCESHK